VGDQAGLIFQTNLREIQKINMTSLIEQTDILNEIVNIMIESAPLNCEKIKCEFEYRYGDGDGDGSYGVGTQFEYLFGSERNFVLLSDPEYKTTGLVGRLHSMMKAHTGGEWTSFTLTLDADGKAHTKFHYPEPKA
jgi:hypothetical protein